MKIIFNKIDSKAWLLFILFLAFILRLISINQSFWLDEATSGLVARDLSFSQIINEFSLKDFHPPLYYLVLRLWSLTFGNSEIALRSLSVILGVASVYLTYLIGSVFNKRVGILSSSFLAINGLHIYYSQEARMYSMSVFLVLLLVYLFIKLVKTKKNLYWYLFTLLIVINAFTDYLPNLIILVFWIYAFLTQKDKIWWKKFIFAHIPLLMVTYFWMPNLITQIQNGLSVGESGSLWWSALGQTNMKNVLLIPVKFVMGRISFYNKVLYYFLSISILFSYFTIFLKGFRKKLLALDLYKLITLWLVVPILISIIIGFKVSVLSYFRLIFVLPAFLIVLSVSMDKLTKNHKRIAVFLVTVVSVLSSAYYLLTPRFHRESWRSLVTYANSESEGPELGVVFASRGQREGYRYYEGPDVVYSANAIPTNLKKLLYIRYVQDIFDAEGAVEKRIQDLGYEKENIHDFNGIIVWEYENRN